MPTPLIPQEVYLLERYSSFEYFAPIRDQWAAMLEHVERCLEVFTAHLPLEYRRRPLHDQPDIVWGEQILPNFRDTMALLDRACIQLKHGDLRGLGPAIGVTGDFRGQIEFWAGWMDEPQVAAVIPNAQETYYDLISAPQQRAWNMQRTFQRIWSPGALSSRYSEKYQGPLDPPERWPRYRLNPAVRVEVGGPITRSGLYLPDIDDSCAALLIEGHDWDDGKVLLRYEDPVTEDGEKLYDSPLPVTEWRSTGWTLIDRAPGETIPFEAGLGAVDTPPARVPAGEPCPRTGWWHTPARADSRRLFKTGDTFPNIDNSDYGSTFWLWSQDQTTPQL